MIDYDDEDYIFEGEYLNGQRNGYGRDYTLFKNSLFIYEGEYLNGKRHGKGKEYINIDILTAISGSPQLIFEGEYLYGKRWNGKGYDGNKNFSYELKNGIGHVKEYYYYNVIFEGEYINGEKNGKGIQFIFNNNSALPDEKFEGNYSNGKKHGIGKEYDEKNNLIFQGNYLYNYKSKGTEYYNDGKVKYVGEYLFNQKWNGKIYDKNENVIYEIINGSGSIKDYYSNGQLKMQGKFKNTIIYDSLGQIIYEGRFKNDEGEFLNGRRWNGIGKESFENLIYEGGYSIGQITRKGKLYRKNEILLFNGEISNGKRWNGVGNEFLIVKLKYRESFHEIFKGEYLNGEKHGKGKEYYFNKKIKFEGEYINDLKWNGKEYDALNISIYEIKNGNGFIKEYDYDGELIFEGEYLNGRKWNGNIYFKNLSIYPIKNGKGFIKEKKYISPDEELVFEGEYVNGQRNGKGKEYNNYQGYTYLEFEGEYLDGLRHGIGRTYSFRNLLFEGDYSNGTIKIIKNGTIKKNKNN